METQYFKTLLTVVKAASFSKAASELCITQSAVSQRIKFMEDRYGHQLLDRSGPLLVATQAGRIVLEKAEKMILLEGEIVKELAKLFGNKRLSLCCTPTFGVAYLPKVLNSFLQQHSESVDLKFIFHTPALAIKGLNDNEFDIAIIDHCEEIDLNDFTTFALPKDELVFVTAPLPEFAGKTVNLDQLLQLRLITRKEGCSSRSLLELNLKAAGMSLSNFRSMVVFDDFRLAIQSVISGGGTAFLSRSLVAEYLLEGSLLAHNLEDFCHLRHRTVAVNRNRGVPELVEAFLESLNGVFYATEGQSCFNKLGQLKRIGLNMATRDTDN